MNPEADALHRLTELRLRMIRSRLDGQAQNDLVTSSNSMDQTSELEILLQEKLERLRMMEARNQALRTQLREAGMLVIFRMFVSY